MTGNHRSVIGEITHAPYQCEKQVSWRERELKNENGTKLRAQFILDASTRWQLKRTACHKGLLGNVSHQGVGAERRVTAQLSDLKRYYGEE